MLQLPLDEHRARGPWRPVLVSAALGAIIGIFHTSTWQVAVETAQVLAGTVQYPPENPFYRYHAAAWSLLHQGLAAFLWLGLDERTLSVLLSGFLCAATFGGITLCSYAVGPRADTAVLAPLVWFALFRDGNAYGVAYPLIMTGTHHTYGMLGRAAALWLAGLAAHRCTKTAMFLLPVLPALHLTWGLYAGAVIAGAWFITSSAAEALRRGWPWLLAGAAVALASLGLQRLWMASPPPVDAAEAAVLLDAFLTHWDGHRLPAPLLLPGTLLAATVTLCAGIVLVLVLRRGSDTTGRMLWAVALVGGVSGLVLLLFARVPQSLPQPVAIAMPGRFVNLAILLVPALVMGGIGRARPRTALIMTALVVLYVVWSWIFNAFLSSDRFGWSLAHWKVLVPALIFATYYSVQPLSAVRSQPTGAVLVALVAAGVLLYPNVRAEALRRTGVDPVLARARERDGLIIAGPGLELVQLRTGRPVLLNSGGLDQLPYVPESGPAMNEALKIVYGVDLLDPPEEAAGLGALPRHAAIELFAARTRQEWQAVARRFGGGRHVSVLVKPTHPLAFEPAARSDEWLLYDISEP